MTRLRARQLQKGFGRRFGGLKVGFVVGESNVPVVLSAVGLSFNCIQSRRESFGCKEGEMALLVEYVLATAIHTGVPPRSNWVRFPKVFRELVIYYRLGTLAKFRAD